MAGAMTVHGYPRRALGADYLRAGGGVALSLLPLATGMVTGGAAAVLAATAALFAFFGVRTVARQATRLTVTADAIAAAGWRRVGLRWAAITRVSLAYYTTRREGGKGWMQLTLRGPGGTLRVDSTLEGFADIARRAAAAAAANRLVLDRVTRSNLRALGVAAADREGTA